MKNSKVYHGGSAVSGFSGVGSSSGADDKTVKVSAIDTTSEFLYTKLYAGTGITLNKLNAGGNEKVEISASSDSPERSTLVFGQPSAATVGVHVPSAVSSSYQTNGMGYFVKDDSHVKKFRVSCPKFITFASNQYLRFQIKTIVMDGSRTSDITQSSGVNLINFDLVFPNTSGGFRYFMGSGIDVDLPVPAGSMIWCVHCAITANTCLGSNCWLELEKD